MRRMYSEQELTKVIKEVFEAELASGALDEQVSDAVDAYLVEHPVDITALEGQDVELNSLDATGLITGGEIVEKMSGYSFVAKETSANVEYEYIYAGAVKNGNKLTLVIAVNITRLSDSVNTIELGDFVTPQEVYSKLYPTQIGAYYFLEARQLSVFANYYHKVDCLAFIEKKDVRKASFSLIETSSMTTNTKFYVRYEATFLLSDSLVPEE